MFLGDFVENSQARSQDKFPEDAKSLTMKSARQGSNDGEILYPKCIGCKAKRQRVQWDGGRAGTVRELFDRTQLNEMNGRRVIWN